MKVSELGEFGLIDLLEEMVSATRNKRSESWRKLITGIGDDAAAWQGDSSVQLATTDTMTEDVHFTLNKITWRELGWKSLAINLSDIAAIGGKPLYALVALSLPADTDAEDIIEMYQGMLELAQKSEVAVAGGNISRAAKVSITITVFGKAIHENLLTRSSAKPGHLVAVTGYLGSSAAGLAVSKGKLGLTKKEKQYLRDAHFKPMPRIAEGNFLAEKSVKTAIDISDGLISDLGHICKASRVGAQIETDLLPVHDYVIANFGNKAIDLALSGGEDYELLFTASPLIMRRVKRLARFPVTVIGRITRDPDAKVEVIDSSGKPVVVRKTGWDHFSKRSE